MARNTANSARSLPQDHLMWRVVDYLTANPTEVLTRSDIVAKFDAAASQVDSLLSTAVAAGMLRREEGTADGTVWSRPRQRGNFPRPYVPSVAAAGRAHRAARRAARRIAFDAIVVESGIPVAETTKPGGQWNALFDRMRPGDSFQLPNVSAAALSHAKLKYCRLKAGARFVTRKVSDTHTRIWRVG